MRLESIGEPQYFDDEQARQRYQAGNSLTVLSREDPPVWYLLVSPDSYRFTVTFYSTSKTPLREVTWEREGAELQCRRIIDAFYPDGDPGGRRPWAEVLTLTQRISADGFVDVVCSSPMDEDSYRGVAGVPMQPYRAPVPAFGVWNRLLTASSPPPMQRYGLDAIDAALRWSDTCVAPTDVAIDDDVDWRVPASARDIMAALDRLIASAAADLAIPVLVRGTARILPLVAGSPSRVTDLAQELRDACEYRAGRGIRLNLQQRGSDSVASYLAALRLAGMASAEYWEFDSGHGVVLARAGDPASLAVHVVPSSWVTERRAEAAIPGIELTWTLADCKNGA